MKLDRRAFIAASAFSALAPALARAAEPPNPLLYRVQRGGGTTYILGAAEATDNGWFVPKIAAALDAADVLWLETPPGSTTAAAEGQTPPPPDPALQKIFAERAFDREHDLFEVLPPAISQRTLDWARKLSLPREQLAPRRPWFARIALQQAYASQRQAKAAAGDLSRIEVLKVLGMVNAVPEFLHHPEVVNGCSDLFVAVLGERGRHARSAVGMGSLPMNITVEIEAVMRIHS